MRSSKIYRSRSIRGIFCVLLLAFAEAGARAPAQTGHTAQRFWQQFQAAVAASDKQRIAGLTVFPFRHQSLRVTASGALDRAEFLNKFDLIFSRGVRRQVARGQLRQVTKADLRAAEREGLDACGEPGDYVVHFLPGEQINYDDDDEAFLHLVFRQINGRFMLHRVIGCN